MRFRALALALSIFAGPLAASGGSPEPWLDGTRAWDTTPMLELDLAAHAAGGDGRPSAGASAQWGVLDTFQLAGEWQQPLQGGASLSELRLQWRESEFPSWRPGFALLARAPYDGLQWAPRAGLAAALDAFECSLVANLEAGASSPWGLRTGFWTPYLVFTLRLGIEAAWSGGSAQAVSPQILLNAPGDLSLGLGARLDAAGLLPPRYLLRLSYQLFPSP